MEDFIQRYRLNSLPFEEESGQMYYCEGGAGIRYFSLCSGHFTKAEFWDLGFDSSFLEKAGYDVFSQDLHLFVEKLQDRLLEKKTGDDKWKYLVELFNLGRICFCDGTLKVVDLQDQGDIILVDDLVAKRRIWLQTKDSVFLTVID